MSLRLFEELESLHAKGILHLDIKPENLKWDAEHNACRILDLGTAVKVENLEHLEHIRPEPIGTEKYMPPEVRKGDARPYSDKGDVYAAAKSMQSLLEKAKGLTTDERKKIEAFIKKGLSDNREDRPTAKEAKAFFNELAVKMQQEKRLSDVAISLQIAEKELLAFIDSKMNDLDKIMLKKGVSLLLKVSHANVHIQQKEIAQQILEKIQSMQQKGEFNGHHLTEHHILAVADALIEARIKNIENTDEILENILKKPSDQIMLKVAQTPQVKMEATHQLEGAPHPQTQQQHQQSDPKHRQIPSQHRVSLRFDHARQAGTGLLANKDVNDNEKAPKKENEELPSQVAPVTHRQGI
jgi:serine/threonine protein kinase